MNIQAKICVGLIVTGAGVFSGLGDAVADDLSTSSARTGLVDEIVVTAQKREARAQDVPMAITAFDEVALEKIGFSDIKDIISYTPSVNYVLPPQSRHSIGLHIRGIQSRGSADPGVGVYYDNLYIGATGALDADLMDVARVEVLPGPQGTLYGRNTIGGAIKFVTAQPTGEWGLKQRLEVGEYDYFKSGTHINFPEVHGVSSKLSIGHNSRDGWLKNSGAGRDYYEDDGNSYRLALRWEPAETVDIDYAFDYRDMDDTPTYHQRQFETESFPFDFPVFPERQYVTWRDVNLDIHDSLLQTMHALTATWDISDRMTLKSISGYMDTEHSILRDNVEGYNIAQLVSNAGDHQQFQQEFLLSGRSDGGGLMYHLGLFYFEEQSDGRNAALNDAFTLSGADPYVPPTLDDLAPFQYTHTDFSSYAIYGQISWIPDAFDKRMTMDLGARASRDDRFQSGTLARGVPHPDGDDSYTSFDPSLTVDYRWTEDVHTFARIATAYRAGGFNFLATRVEPYGAENLTSYEVGLKSMLLDRRLRLNVNVFRSDYDDIQVAEVIPPTPEDPVTRNITVNGGTGVIQGADALVEMAVGEGLSLRASATYLDATAEQTNPVTGVVSDTALAAVPELSYVLAAEHSWAPGAYGLYSLLVSFHHEGSKLSPSRTTDTHPACDKMNARLSLSELEVMGGTMLLALWGDNITNADCQAYHAWDAVNYIRPRNYGLSIQLNFE